MKLQIIKENGVFRFEDSKDHYFQGNDIRYNATEKRIKFTYNSPSGIKESTYQVSDITLYLEGEEESNFSTSKQLIKRLEEEGFNILTTHVSGNITVQGGSKPFKLISQSSTNATSVKTTGGLLLSLVAIGLTEDVRFLKFYDKNTAPVVGTDIPVITFPIPSNTQGAGIAVSFPKGITFTSGIALALTTGSEDNNTGDVTAGDVVINLTYSNI